MTGTMSRRWARGTAVVVGAVSIFGSFPVVACPGASASAQPHIVVQPSTARAGSSVAVRGTGFPARTRLTVEECSASSWIAPQDPCVKHNAVSTRTNQQGGFRLHMVVRTCPVRTSDGTHRRSRTCYIGVPHPSGIDTIELTGAAQIRVTR